MSIRRNSDKKTPFGKKVGGAIPSPVNLKKPGDEDDNIIDDILEDDEEEISEVEVDDIEEISEDDFIAPPSNEFQPRQQQSTAREQFSSGFGSSSSSRRERLDTPEKEQALTYLSFQKVYFPKRIPQKGDAMTLLADYFPYVELRKRTIPLPNVKEYLSALQQVVEEETTQGRRSEFSRYFYAKDNEGNLIYQDWERNTNAMFDLAFNVFENTVILLVRQNKNTQIIFPGKSTTSYKGRGKEQKVKNYVWTNSVEFNTFDYSMLPQNQSLSVNADYNVKDKSIGKIKEVAVGDGMERILEGSFGSGASSLSYEVDMDLTDSLKVAEDYLVRKWVGHKVAKARKRLQYTVLVFADMTGLTWIDPYGVERTSRAKAPAMDLQFMYGYKLGRDLGGSVTGSRWSPIEMAEGSSVPQENRIRNPRQKRLPSRKSSKSTKRLPLKSKKVRSKRRSPFGNR